MWLTKYSANGNDFLITTSLKKRDFTSLAKDLCHRFNGIGSDGFVVLLPHTKFAYQWDFYNADGSRADMCGNASRCVAHFAYNNKIAPKKHSFLSKAGEIKVEVNKNIVEVNLGEVKILRNITESQIDFTLLDSGVPHLVAFVQEDILQDNKQNLTFLKHLREKYNANVNLAVIKNRSEVEIITYERGVENITLACGTGMCAVYFNALIHNMIDKNAILIPPSNDKISLRMDNNEVCFKGSVRKIAEILV